MDERLVLRPHIQTGISYVKHFKDVKPEFFKTLKEEKKTNTDKIKHIFGSTWTQPCMGICMELLPAFTHTQAYLALSQKKKQKTNPKQLKWDICPQCFVLHYFSCSIGFPSLWDYTHVNRYIVPMQTLVVKVGTLLIPWKMWTLVHSWSYLNTNISSCLNFFFKWS